MAIAPAQSKSINSNAITFDNPVVAGRPITLTCRNASGPPDDNKGGNTYHKRGTTADRINGEVYDVIVVNGGSGFTITVPGADRLSATEWSGFTGTPTFRQVSQHDTGTGFPGGGTDQAARSGAITVTTETLLYCGVQSSSGSFPYTPINSFTNILDDAFAGIQASYRVVGSGGSYEGGEDLANPGGDWGCILVTYEDVATGPLTASATDGMKMGDAPTTHYANGVASTTDGMKMGDTVTPQYKRHIVSTTDGMKMGEDLTITWVTDSGPDGMKMGDTCTPAYKRHASTQTDGMKMGEVVTPTYKRHVLSRTDGMKMGDSAVATLPNEARSRTDGMKMGDSVTGRVTRWAVSLSDGMRMGDSVRVPHDGTAAIDEAYYYYRRHRARRR